MSEFECSQGHLMKSGEYTCPKCGGRIARMDGMTKSEAAADEREEPEDREND